MDAVLIADARTMHAEPDGSTGQIAKYGLRLSRLGAAFLATKLTQEICRMLRGEAGPAGKGFGRRLSYPMSGVAQP